MKISVDGKQILELSETQKKVIMNDIPKEIFEQDMCARLCYVMEHKYERCMERLKNEWCGCHDGLPSKLSVNGIKSIPTDDQELAELIFAQPNYLDRSARELTNV